MPPPEPAGSVTHWIDRLKAGDPDAAGPLWDGYFSRLVELARRKLGAAPRAAEDEEDVAVSAFKSFCRGAAEGRFARLDGRGDLWQVLFVLTARKAADAARRGGREKRGGGRVVQASALAADSGDPLAGTPGTGPAPDLAALVADECRRLLDELGDDTLRSVAVWKLEGYTNAEIAARIGRVEGTVERKLALIRLAWRRESPT